MTPELPGEITRLLEDIREGEIGARDRLIELVYATLREQAGDLMRRERAGHTLPATAVVHEALLKLLQGGVLASREGGEQAAALQYLGDMRAALDADAGLPMIRRAFELGLTEPAECGFAAGLLAETSADAVAGFTDAVRTDPTHRRANEMLVWTLLLMGRREEARQRLAVLQGYYPADGRIRLVTALLAAYDDDDAAMTEHLRQCESILTPGEYALAHFSVTKFRECLDPDMLMDNQRVANFLAGILNQFGEVIAKRAAERGRLANLSFPPILQKTFGQFFPAGASIPIIPPNPLSERIANAVQRFPEGTLWLMLAKLRYQDGKYPESLAAAEKALATPALLNIRPAALEAALLAEAELHFRDRANHLKPRAAVVRERLRAIVAERGVRARNGAPLVDMANAIGELELARLIAQELVRQDPKNPISWDLLAIMESKLNNKLKAIGHFRKALEQPQDAGYRAAVEGRLKQSIEEARKQAAEFLATPSQ